eukprot:EG_transcript_5205
MSVDNSGIDFEQARDSFAPNFSPPRPAVGQSPLLQLNDGPLSVDQVQTVFQELLNIVIVENPNSPPGDKGSSSLSRLVARIVKEGMAGAEDGDVTGRELKFAALCNTLAAFMRVQNPAILTNITQCVEQAICTLVPTPVSSASIFETLLSAFLHSIRLAKISAMYHARREKAKAVVYIPATNPPLVSDLVALPDVTFRHCPLHEMTHRMHTLEELVMEDVAAGLLPVMVHTVVGMSPYSFSDDLTRLRQLCIKYDMVLSLDGPGLALLLTNDLVISPAVETIKDPTLKLALTLPLHHILHDLPMSVWMTYTRLPELANSLEVMPPIPNPSVLVGLYIYLSGTTAKALKGHMQRKVEQARYLHATLKALPCVQLLTDPANIYAIKWRFSGVYEPERRLDHQLIHRLLCRRWEDLKPQNGSLSLHEKYFSYMMLSHSLPATVTDEMAELFKSCDGALRSIAQCRLPVQVGLANEEQLVLLPPLPTSPFVLAAFRFVPSFYKDVQLDAQQQAEVNIMNEKMGSVLRQKDAVFQSLVTEGQVAVCIAADPGAFQPVFGATYVEQLLEMVREVLDYFEKGDESMMGLRAEITKKGIEEAERIIKQLQEEEDAAESVFRLIPIVNILTNWMFPLEKPAPSPIQFDLRTTKMMKGHEFTTQLLTPR